MSRVDARSSWNAVERLATSGQTCLAEDLAALLDHPKMREALASIADESGHGGGLHLAEQAAFFALPVKPVSP